MRFIGCKKNLLSNIDAVISENIPYKKEAVFCDIFSGTGSVARYFKNKYRIFSNDSLYFSYVLQKATVENNITPTFSKLKSVFLIQSLSLKKHELLLIITMIRNILLLTIILHMITVKECILLTKTLYE